MEHFTPLASLSGGMLIGLSAAMLWLGIGRIAGISGIAGGLVGASRGEGAWRLAFLAGLVGAPVLLAAWHGPPHTAVTAPGTVLAAAGLLVGIGTQLGGGCTSGHGVCGLARLSRRSIVATAVFMATAALTVFVTRHLVGA